MNGGRVRDAHRPEPKWMSSTGELIDIERVTISLEGGRWKSTRLGNSLAAYPTARPVLNGGREETCRRVTRLAPTQHHHTGVVVADVFGRRKDAVFLQRKAWLEPFGLTRFYTDHWGTYTRHLDAEVHSPGKRHTQKIERKHLT